MKTIHHHTGPCLLMLALLFAAACETVNKVVDTAVDVAVESGTIREHEGAAIRRTAGALIKSFEEITPEQEYYLGRAVAASLLARYEVYDAPELNHYLNVLGQSLALFSEAPVTFGGYRFLALDSDDINAFAAPGGFIFITRGLIQCCRSEDELAAVLAHEIAHVQNRDALSAIRKGRLTSTAAIALSEGVTVYTRQEVAELTQVMEGAIGDILETLIERGYSRSREYAADADATRILTRIGYDPHALVTVIGEMQRHITPGGYGFGATHPAPDDRIRRLQRALPARHERYEPPERQQRFEQAIAGLDS